MLEERIVRHVPKNFSKIFHQFMKIPNCTIRCKVTGKRVNRGAGLCLEIPVRKEHTKVFENVNKKVNKCLK